MAKETKDKERKVSFHIFQHRACGARFKVAPDKGKVFEAGAIKPKKLPTKPGAKLPKWLYLECPHCGFTGVDGFEHLGAENVEV